MDLELRPFTDGDLEAYERWKRAIDIGRFMSRTTPFRFDGHVDQTGSDYRWFVIVADGRDVGTIWFDREPEDASAMRVSLCLADQSYAGKGIGRRAIERAIESCRPWFPFTRVRLHVRVDNARAIACYRACGFKETGRGRKTTGNAVIEFLTMEREA